jgi:hypothetical protein
MSITPAAIRDPTITEAHPRMMRIITSGFITINMLYYFGMYAFPLRTALAYTAHKQKWIWGQSRTSIVSSLRLKGFLLISDIN